MRRFEKAGDSDVKRSGPAGEDVDPELVMETVEHEEKRSTRSLGRTPRIGIAEDASSGSFASPSSRQSRDSCSRKLTDPIVCPACRYQDVSVVAPVPFASLTSAKRLSITRDPSLALRISARGSRSPPRHANCARVRDPGYAHASQTPQVIIS